MTWTGQQYAQQPPPMRRNPGFGNIEQPDVQIVANSLVNGPGAKLPEFQDLAQQIDHFAKQVPWWVWFAAGAYVAKTYWK